MDLSQIGVTTASLPNRGLHDVIDTVRALQASCIELLAFKGGRHSQGELAGFYLRDLAPQEQNELAARLRGFRRLGLHAPFIDLHPVSPDPHIATFGERELRECVDAMAFLGGGVCTCHAVSMGWYFRNEETFDSLVGLFRRLGAYAAERNVRIGIETGVWWHATPDGPLADLARYYTGLIEAVDHPAVGATIDTGHFCGSVPASLRQSGEGVQVYNQMLCDTVRKLAGSVFHVHLHNVRVSDWRDHRRPDAGLIDMAAFFHTLDAIGYEGAVSLELEEPDSERVVRESIAYVASLIHSLPRSGSDS